MQSTYRAVNNMAWNEILMVNKKAYFINLTTLHKVVKFQLVYLKENEVL